MLLAVLAAVPVGCGEARVPGAESGGAAVRELSLAELGAADAVYTRYCAECHGPGAVGTERGPPLVHRVYEPRHHSDFAFHLAIRQGVRAHHWRFGDMPPVEGISAEEADLVVVYIRRLQRDAGIF